MIITMILSILIEVQFSSPLHFQKCCGMHQRLSTDLKACVDLFTDIDQGNKVNSLYEYDWHLPINTKILSSRDLNLVTESSSIDLELKILQNDGNQKPFSEHYDNIFSLVEGVSLVDNGSLILTNEALPHTCAGVYPNWAYCLDGIFSKENLTKATASQARSGRSFSFDSGVILQPCRKLPRIRRCCPENMYLLDQQKCQNDSNFVVPNDWINQVLPLKIDKESLRYNYDIFDRMLQCDGNTVSNLPQNVLHNTSKFIISQNGQVNIEGQSKAFSSDEYCLYQGMMDTGLQTSLLYCSSKQSYFIEILYTIYYFVGSVFLAATLLVYGLVRELRRTFYARIMMSHVACLFICYSIMVINNMSKPKRNTPLCTITAYVLQFLFLASMFWLNVMCFYMSRMFKIKVTLQPTHSLLTKNKAYFLYSVYVWGMTLTISTVTFLAEKLNFIDEDLKPRMGLQHCWFTGKPAKFLFFYLPITVVWLVNLVLFLFTVKGVLSVQKESHQIIIGRDSNKHKGNKPVAGAPKQLYKLRLSIKLCALMGMTWLFEIASWALDVPEYYWYVTDAINSFRGFFIFVICCCKKKVLVLLWNQICRRESQNKIELNEYYLRTAASNPALARRLTITSETDGAYQLAAMSIMGKRKASLPILPR